MAIQTGRCKDSRHNQPGDPHTKASVNVSAEGQRNWRELSENAGWGRLAGVSPVTYRRLAVEGAGCRRGVGLRRSDSVSGRPAGLRAAQTAPPASPVTWSTWREQTPRDDRRPLTRS